MAVAALEGLEHGGDGEGQQQQPDDDRDVRRLLQDFQEVLAARVHHVEVAVDGGDGEEGDAGAAVQEQHEEHGLAHGVVLASALALDVVVRLDGQAEEQQDVSQHQVEQEHVVSVGFPELQLEYEEVQDGGVERQSQDEDHDHHGCIELIQRLVVGFAVLDRLKSTVSHLSGFKVSRYTGAKHTIPPQSKTSSLTLLCCNPVGFASFSRSSRAFLLSKVSGLRSCCARATAQVWK